MPGKSHFSSVKDAVVKKRWILAWVILWAVLIVFMAPVDWQEHQGVFKKTVVNNAGYTVQTSTQADISVQNSLYGNRISHDITMKDSQVTVYCKDESMTVLAASHSYRAPDKVYGVHYCEKGGSVTFDVWSKQTHSPSGRRYIALVFSDQYITHYVYPSDREIIDGMTQ